MGNHPLFMKTFSIRLVTTHTPDRLGLLRHATSQLNEHDFLSGYVQELGSQMLTLMMLENGVGLSAQQVGSYLRIITVAFDPFILCNPVIVKHSGTQLTEEGCLSFPGQFYKINRAQRVEVEFQDANGMAGVIDAQGFEAVVLQHEIDHLNGILFFDRLAEQIGLEEAKKILPSQCIPWSLADSFVLNSNQV